MNDDVFREHLLAWLKAIGEALVDQSRALEALAVAVQKQSLQGTLRVKIDAPPTKRRRKVRARA